jgi:hypothetical protein
MSRITPDEAIDRTLPDERIVRDLINLLREGGDEAEIEFETGNVRIPAHPHVTLVTKSYRKEYFPIGFGSGYRVQVAVGDVEQTEYGILKAQYCFATLYYTTGPELITVDFHKEMR